MGAVNPNWTRWIKASFAKYFNDTLTGKLLMYVEGADRSTNRQVDYCEFRFDGPHYYQYSPDDFEIKVMVNVLVASLKDDNDLYKIERNNGLVASVFAPSIATYKFGNGPDDNPTSLLYCFELFTPPGRGVTTSNFGLIESDSPVSQSVIEGQYRGFLSLP